MHAENTAEINKQVGAVLRARRVQLGRSQKNVAEQVGISFQQLQKYEAGLNSLTLARAVDICNALGMTLTELLPTGKAAEVMAQALPLALSKNFQKLSEDGRKTVLALVHSLAKQEVSHA